jgi:hypothetical protein
MPLNREVIVDVGGVAVRLNTTDASLVRVLERRFRRFLNPSAQPVFEFDITVVDAATSDPDAELTVHGRDGTWTMARGDFRAEWNVARRRGHIWQTVSPYAIDSILRIVHSLVLAGDGGFLLHASSAIRDGRAFLFTGPSGAGKSTIVGLAPRDVTVLTDEVSYLRRTADGYVAFGTPFAGELSDLGEPASAPVAALFQLGRGADNQHDRLDAGRTVRTLMRNILFFADDPELVGRVLDTACDFAAHVPAFELRFAPDARVWSTIQ